MIPCSQGPFSKSSAVCDLCWISSSVWLDRPSAVTSFWGTERSQKGQNQQVWGMKVLAGEELESRFVMLDSVPSGNCICTKCLLLDDSPCITPQISKTTIGMLSWPEMPSSILKAAGFLTAKMLFGLPARPNSHLLPFLTADGDPHKLLKLLLRNKRKTSKCTITGGHITAVTQMLILIEWCNLTSEVMACTLYMHFNVQHLAESNSLYNFTHPSLSKSSCFDQDTWLRMAVQQKYGVTVNAIEGLKMCHLKETEVTI